MKKLLRRRDGFTLVELLIGMVVFVLILAGVSTILSQTFLSQQFNFNLAANAQIERDILNNISSEIKNSTTVTTPAGGGTGNALVYTKVGDLANRTITIGTGSDANTIVFKDPAGTTIQRYGKGYVSSITFTRSSIAGLEKRIQIDLTLRNSNPTNAPTNTITTYIYTLN